MGESYIALPEPILHGVILLKMDNKNGLKWLPMAKLADLDRFYLAWVDLKIIALRAPKMH